MPDLQVINILRVDLSDPDIQLMTTPQYPSYLAESRETAVMTVNSYATNYKTQVAINANDFAPNSYSITPGTPVDVTGVLINQGQVSSTQQSWDQYNCAVLFTIDKKVTYSFTNWPPHSIDGVYNAICGTHPILENGVNIGNSYLPPTAFIHQVQPRTIVGTSQDGRYLFMATIDGRQPGYSDGALDWEAGVWMLQAGAYTAVNMDGGGSATMVMVDSTGLPKELNYSSCLRAYGYDRPVGAHLGVFAKPVAGFINDVAVNVDNTAATVTWTTTDPSTTQVKYGLSTNLTNSTLLSSSLATNHAALMSNLIPNTGYYFNVVSSLNGVSYTSSNFFLVTSNYVTTNAIFDVGNTWSYNSGNLDGVAWKSKTYSDAAWSSGPGVLWVNASGPNTAIPNLATEIACDPNSYPYPFTNYYFRTHFTYTNQLRGVSLIISAYVDDGAVFYLNGGEIYRLRMPAYPTAIGAATKASGFPNSSFPTTDTVNYGNATFPDFIQITGSAMTNLVNGDNVLAVEVHNYARGSLDITFGMSLAATPQYDIQPEIYATPTNSNKTILSWDRGGFTLFQGRTLNGTWTAVQGPSGSVVSSPYVVTNTANANFYRLRRN